MYNSAFEGMFQWLAIGVCAAVIPITYFVTRAIVFRGKGGPKQ